MRVISPLDLRRSLGRSSTRPRPASGSSSSAMAMLAQDRGRPWPTRRRRAPGRARIGWNVGRPSVRRALAGPGGVAPPAPPASPLAQPPVPSAVAPAPVGRVRSIDRYEARSRRRGRARWVSGSVSTPPSCSRCCGRTQPRSARAAGAQLPAVLDRGRGRADRPDPASGPMSYDGVARDQRATAAELAEALHALDGLSRRSTSIGRACCSSPMRWSVTSSTPRGRTHVVLAELLAAPLATLDPATARAAGPRVAAIRADEAAAPTGDAAARPGIAAGLPRPRQLPRRAPGRSAAAG